MSLNVASIVGAHEETCCGVWNVGTSEVTEASTGERNTVSVRVSIIETDGVLMLLSGCGKFTVAFTLVASCALMT